MTRSLALLAVLASGPAAAQDAAAGVRACAAAGGAADCVGSEATACQAAPGGGTTPGIAACLTAEAEAWDRLLNETWAALIAAARARDDADPGAGHEASLRAAQRAWLAFREADCAQEYGAWGMGSMRQIAGADCRLRRTATRALELGAKRDAPGGG